MALAFDLAGSSSILAQTKQLKSPSTPPKVVTEDATNTTDPLVVPNNGSSSYSIVITNKTKPDGKVVQSKKVWNNGELVEESETELDGEEAQNALNATIQLPNGQITNGRVFRSDDDFDFFKDDDFNGLSPFESMRRMEEQMRRHQERMQSQFDMLRQQISNFGDPSAAPNQSLNAFNQARAVSKYWIGANLGTIPEIVTSQLPIDENKGVILLYVVPNSPAAKAGLQRYDVIVKIGDEETNDPAGVTNTIEKIGAKTVPIQYYRKGKLETCEIEIGERPKAMNLPSAASNNGIQVVRPGLIVPSDAADAAEKSQDAASGAAEEPQNAASGAAEEPQNAADAEKE